MPRTTEKTTETKAPETGTAIAIPKTEWLALRDGSDIAEAIQANLAAGEKIEIQDLTRVKNPTGGDTTWRWEDESGEHETKQLQGLLVHTQMCGLLWPSEEASKGTLPLLRTDDLEEAYMVGDDPGDIDLSELEKYRLSNGRFDWNKLPWNQWGTGKKGVGKRCQEQRMLFILQKSDPWPLLVIAGPGSLKKIKPFVKKLPVPMWRAYVGLSLQKAVSKSVGQDYAQIAPHYLGSIDKAAGAVVFETYTRALRKVATQITPDQDDDIED